MKRVLLAAAVVLSGPAFAHVEPGVYKGETPDGQPCEMKAVGMKFENGLHHPLTERVVVEYGAETFNVGHPSAIDALQGQVTFNHDRFEGLLPNPNGAKALVLDMAHTPQFEGPVAFTFVDHDWRAKTSAKIRCENIKLQN